MSEFETELGFQDCWSQPREGRGVGLKPKGGGGGRPARATGDKATKISAADKARLDRVVRGVPEVMVKVTRPAKRDKHGNTIQVTRNSEALRAAEHLSYISRNGKIELENDRGEQFKGKADVTGVYREWLEKHDDARAAGDASDRTRITTSIMFSMPASANATMVKDAVRAVAEQEFGGRHDYVMALHTDTKHPHVHLTVRTVAHDGSKLNLRKADLQHLRDAFAGRLRRRGIEAESTPRHARGVTRRGEVTPVYKIRQRGKVPNADARKVREVRRDLEDHNGSLPKQVWDRALASRRERVADNYQRALHLLEQSDAPEDRRLSRALGDFADNVGSIKTQRAALATTITPDFQSAHEQKAVQRAQLERPAQEIEGPKPDRSR